MNKYEFESQLRMRKEEIEEMSEMVQAFANKLKSRHGLVKASMITAYRQGICDLLEVLDQKAINAKNARDLTKKILNETRGNENEQSNSPSESNKPDPNNYAHGSAAGTSS